MYTIENKNICRAEEAACTNAHTLSVASINPLSVSAGDKRVETSKITWVLFLSTFLFTFFAFFSTNNVARAMDTVDLSMPVCTHNFDGCNDWHEWVYHSRILKYQSEPHKRPLIGPKYFDCNVIVNYRARQCKTNIFMVQYDIISIELDLAHKIWHFWSGGYVFPCIEALSILRGSEQEVSGYFNELYNAVYEDIVWEDYTMAFRELEKLDKTLAGKGDAHYVHNPCKQPDPGNPWNKGLLTVVTVNATCQATCVTWSYERKPIWYYEVESKKAIGPFLHHLQSSYDQSDSTDTGRVRVDPIDDQYLADLNAYVQTEINPFIPSSKHRVPTFQSGDAPVMKLTKMPCADDFCCIYSMTVCQDEYGNASLQNKQIIGNVPQECLDADTISWDRCPKSIQAPAVYPCVSSCNISQNEEQQPLEINEINEISDVTINIYPNPTNKLVNFEIPNGRVLNELELFDISGNLLYTFNTNTTTLDLSKFTPGEYYICFTLDNTKYYRSIIVSK